MALDFKFDPVAFNRFVEEQRAKAELEAQHEEYLQECGIPLERPQEDTEF